MREAEDIVKELLIMRNIEEKDFAEFFSDSPQTAYDPFLLKDMEEGVDIVLSEAKAGTKICIYGDYDVDGVTSICILMSVIGALTDNIMYYVPSRFDEGYGLNKDAIDRIFSMEVGLIVTADCGCASYEEVEYAKKLGMKVVVTDHHEIDRKEADTVLIDPKRKGCGYPFKGLAGCGVAFKLSQAVQRKAGLPKSLVLDNLDLAAIGTVSDIVPLRDENRTIVKYGLALINSRKRKSLDIFLKRLSIYHVTSSNIGYIIGPHINAAGRMARAAEAVELFLASDEKKVKRQAEKLIEYNRDRKNTQEEAYKKCMEVVEDGKDFFVLRNDGLHEGVAGIVAGKIKDRLNRPVALFTSAKKGYLKGTARSIGNIDLYSFLCRAEQYFESFGGHKSACGMLIKEENFTSFMEFVDKEIQSMARSDESIFEKTDSYDMEILLEEATVKLARWIKKIEPFGQDNREPLFLIRKVSAYRIKRIGKNGEHIKFSLYTEGENKPEFIYFFPRSEAMDKIKKNEPLDIIGRLNVNEFRGKCSVQIKIEEIM